MHAINTRRWPRYHVHLPVSIVASPSTSQIAVPGLVCELSRSGMELYGGVNLQPGDLVEVEFQIASRISVDGMVCNRSGFCFGLEFRSVRAEPQATPEALESLILQRHTAYLREYQQNVRQFMQAVQEMRQCRKDIEIIARDRPSR
jgi:PilZ domain-containing protein